MENHIELPSEGCQNVLAEICSMCRSIKYNQLTKQTHLNDSYYIGAELEELVEKFQLSPQDWDKLYDILHRSGWNK